MLKVILVLLFVFQISAQTAKVKFVIGKVEVQKKGETNWKRINLRTVLSQGDRLRSSFASRAEIRTPDQTILRLGQNSVLELNMIKTVGKKKTANKVKLWAGSMWAKFTKLFADEEENTVATPTAVAAIRGTELDVKYNENTGMSNFVLRTGIIVVRTSGGDVNMNAGTTTNVDQQGNSSTETTDPDDESELGDDDDFDEGDTGLPTDSTLNDPNGLPTDSVDNTLPTDSTSNNNDGGNNDDDDDEIKPEDDSPNFLDLDQSSSTFTDAADVASGIEISGKTKVSANLTIDGQRVNVNNDGTFQHFVSAKEGNIRINVSSNEKYGNITTTLNFKVNISEPELVTDVSDAQVYTSEPLLTIGMQATDLTSNDILSLFINSKLIKTGNAPLNVNESISLRSGENTINIEVRDEVGHTTAFRFTAYYDGDPPEIRILSGLEDVIPTTSFGELPPGLPSFPYRIQARQIYGIVVDKAPSSGLEKLYIQGKQVTIRNDGSFSYLLDFTKFKKQLEEAYKLNKVSGGEFIIPLRFEVEDKAGNRYIEESFQIVMKIPAMR